MDNLTHSVIGLMLARAWSARTVLEAATLVTAANLPDLDALAEPSLGLERDQLFAHRGIVHSLAAARAGSPPTSASSRAPLVRTVSDFSHRALDTGTGCRGLRGDRGGRAVGRAQGYVGGPCVRLWLDADFNVVHENAVAWR